MLSRVSNFSVSPFIRSLIQSIRSSSFLEARKSAGGFLARFLFLGFDFGFSFGGSFSMFFIGFGIVGTFGTVESCLICFRFGECYPVGSWENLRAWTPVFLDGLDGALSLGGSSLGGSGTLLLGGLLKSPACKPELFKPLLGGIASLGGSECLLACLLKSPGLKLSLVIPLLLRAGTTSLGGSGILFYTNPGPAGLRISK